VPSRSQAARSGFTVLFMRAPRLLEELRVAHGDGTFGRRLAQLARINASKAEVVLRAVQLWSDVFRRRTLS